MNQYDLEDLYPTCLQHTVKCGVRIDFTLRGPGLGRKVSFLRGKWMDFTPQRFGFLQMNQYDLEDLDPTRL